MKNVFVYDLETYPNCFTCCIADMQERKLKVFEVSTRKDQREQMFEYLRNVRRQNGFLIGFNNLFFDEPVLQYVLLNKKATVQEIYDQAMKIIKSGFGDNRWQYQIREKDRLLQQVDLFKIHHFDNKARATSLKMIEYNSRSANIEDLPFPVGKYLTDSEMDTLIKYNCHDVKETIKFYEASKNQIEFREKLQTDYGMNAINWNDVKIGKEYFVMELEKAGVDCYSGGKPKQTKRTYIDLVDCIFPYVKFERPEFNAILEWLRKQRITETKGVFSDIMEHELGEVAKYALMTVKSEKLKTKPTDVEIEQFKKDKPLCWIEEIELKAKIPKKDGGGFKKAYWLRWRVAESLNVVINGLCYVFGTGGIHASLEKQVICSDDEYIIEDEDVSSFYPNLAIKNRIYPEHLAEKFCDVYEYLYELRKTYPKQAVENGMLKLALNGTYGASNDQFSPFYDPMFTMQITINGQLSLCMIVEQLLKLEGMQIIQCNTDGLTFKRKRSDEEKVRSIVEWWQDTTKLELERNDYSKMVLRDVNSYVAVYLNGKLKSKGAYEWKDLPHHKNQSSLIVKMAAEAYLSDNTDPEEFIRGHKDKYDFMLRTKVPRSSKLVLVDDTGKDNQVQNICRYYISTKGMEMVKVMPPTSPTKTEEVWVNHQTMEEVTISSKTDIAKYEKKGFVFSYETETPCDDRRFVVESGWKVKVTNDINAFGWDIDYQYYIEKAWKLIEFADEDVESTIEVNQEGD
jgi:hypothetical protein